MASCSWSSIRWLTVKHKGCLLSSLSACVCFSLSAYLCPLHITIQDTTVYIQWHTPMDNCFLYFFGHADMTTERYKYKGIYGINKWWPGTPEDRMTTEEKAGTIWNDLKFITPRICCTRCSLYFLKSVCIKFLLCSSFPELIWIWNDKYEINYVQKSFLEATFLDFVCAPSFLVSARVMTWVRAHTRTT